MELRMRVLKDEEIQMEGELWLDGVCKRYVFLTQGKLAYSAVNIMQSERDRRVRRVAEVRNVRVAAFEEGRRWGLWGGDRGQGELYCERKEELEQWLQSLSSLSFLTNIESDYHFLHKLGTGSYSQVFAASDTTTSQQVAIKRIVKNQWEPFPARLTNEVEVLRRLDHPGVVKLLRVYEERKDVCLVLSYQPGLSLQSFFSARWPLAEEHIRQVIANLLETLVYVHSRGVVHRDMKPENVIVEWRGQSLSCCLIDFGLASPLSTLKPGLCGTPGYVAPEVLRHQVTSEKVDIFSLGMVAYTLVKGKNPFAHIDRQTTLLLNQKCRLNYDPSKWREVSPQFLTLLQEMTQEAPHLRPSAEECLRHPWFSVELSASQSPLPYPKGLKQMSPSGQPASEASTNGDEKSPLAWN